MADETGYSQLGEEFLMRARQIADPELRAIYLRLALAYDKLARFHEQMKVILALTQSTKDKSD